MNAGAPELRIVVVDDEAPARAVLIEYLAQIPDCRVVADCRDGYEAVQMVSDLRPDLLILDIQMPKLDGFDVLELLDDPPAIVFATAYEEHAVRAFELAAVDYLLKPFSAERLHRAVERARERILRGQPQNLDRLLEELQPVTGTERILVRQEGKVHVLPVDRLDYAESQDDYILLHSGGESLRKKQTLKRLTEQLDPARFVRVHRCFLVNLDRVDRLEPYSRESRVAILTDGTRIPVSRAGYGRLKETL
jgi:two-component system LytT family response regulator